MLSRPNIPGRLRSAFPSALGAEVDQALAVFRATDPAPSESDVGPISLGGETLHIPLRVYFDEPAETDFRRLSETQQLLISCLCTRHCDGFVRERHLRALLSSTHTWVAPFVFALIGDYVVEIVQVVEQQATTPMKEHLAQFGTGDSKFCALTRRRVVSYWDRYYRTRFRFEDYPGFRLLDMLGLWPNNEGRSLRTG